MSNENIKNISNLSEDKRLIAMERYNIISPYLFDSVRLSEISKSSNIPYSTLTRWTSRYKKHGISGLVNLERKDKGKFKFINDELKLVIEGLALKKPKLSIKTIHRKAETICNNKNWNKPCYDTVYKIVKSIDPAMTTLSHEGAKAFSEKYDILIKRNTTYPNEVWQADHSFLPVWLIDGNDYKKPWLTIIMDDFSRCVAGYLLSFQSPCNTNTSLALRQAIWHKSESKWHICGIPDSFYTDNGSDFTSHHMEQVNADIKMKLVFSIPGKPRGRGIIERFFQSIEQLLLCELPGYMPNGEKPIKKPTLQISELEVIIRQYIIENYNYRRHSEIKDIPQERWDRNGYIPRMPNSLEQLDLLLLTEAKTRKVRPDGIHFQGLKYMDVLLSSFVGEDVIIRYNPSDMAEIRIYHENKFLCKAICQELSGVTIKLKDIMRARNQYRRKIKEEIKHRLDVADLYTDIETKTLETIIKKDTKIQENNKPKLKRYLNE